MPPCDLAEPLRVRHLRFMVDWWSGRILPWVHCPDKLANVQRKLAAWGE